MSEMTEHVGLRSRVLSLTAANIVDYGFQFLLPVLLVRFLDVADFADYRLAWLVIGTAMAIAPFFMPRTLFYFLPRVSAGERIQYVNQCLIFLLGAGALAAFFVSELNPWLPEKVKLIEGGGWFLPAFAMVWVAASLIETLPNADNRVVLQAKIIAGLALARTVLVGAAAMTGKLDLVFLCLLIHGVLKLLLSIGYIGLNHGWRLWHTARPTWKAQLVYTLPFGLCSALFLLRGQVDQWVVAAIFQPGEFAAFTVAAVVAPLVSLIRTSVNNAVLPRMNSLQANDDAGGMIGLNRKANSATVFVLLAFLGLVFAQAEHIVTVLYTDAYVAAGEVMRVNVIGLVGVAIEVTTIMHVLNQGRFLLGLDLLVIFLAVLFSYLGGLLLGLPGAALGTALTLWVGNAACFWRISKLTGIELKSLQDWRAILLAAGAAIVSTSAALFVDTRLVDIPPVARLLWGSILYIGVYFFTVRLLGGGDVFAAMLFNRALQKERS